MEKFELKDLKRAQKLHGAFMDIIGLQGFHGELGTDLGHVMLGIAMTTGAVLRTWGGGDKTPEEIISLVNTMGLLVPKFYEILGTEMTFRNGVKTSEEPEPCKKKKE